MPLPPPDSLDSFVLQPILVINAGSSSLKCALFRDGLVDRVTLDAPAGSAPPLERALHELRAAELLGHPVAIGHRVVHGGQRFDRPAVIDEHVVTEIERLAPLAPLHNPPAAWAIREARRLFPRAQQVATFDTSFFRDLPIERRLFPVPWNWHERCELRRYGFHGVSHEYSMHRAAELLLRPVGELCLITCHLGAGCSVTAIERGRPVATSMGFTPLDGLMMATRPGALDPGLLTYVQRQLGLSLEELDRTLSHDCGLLGITGSADFREIERRAAVGDERASLGLRMFIDRVAQTVAGYRTTLPHWDALVLTAGIGENSAGLREQLAQRLAHLGVAVDPERNAEPGDPAVLGLRDRCISPADQPAVLIVEAREDLQIARSVHKCLTTPPGPTEPPEPTGA